MSCPSPATVERVYWIAQRGGMLASDDAELQAHATSCTRCSEQWAEIQALAKLGAAIQPSPFVRREELRTTLLSKIHDVAASPVPGAWRRWWLAPAVAAAAVLAWWAIAATPEHAVARAEVLAHGDVRMLVVASAPDETVRLVDGALTVSVPANVRFRVITGDDELAASGAAFDVSATNDRLASVRVIHGSVKLSAAGETTVLDAGAVWRATQIAATPPAPLTPPTPPAVAPPPSIAIAPIPEPARRTPPPTADAPAAASDEAPAAEPVAPSLPQPPPPRGMGQQAFDDGWAALRAGEYARAAAAFERAAAVGTRQDLVEDATFWRAVALARSGEVVSAAHVLDAFVRAFPRATRAGEARVMLGWLLFERGDRGSAKAHFEAALADPSQRVRSSARQGLDAIARKSR